METWLKDDDIANFDAFGAMSYVVTEVACRRCSKTLLLIGSNAAAVEKMLVLDSKGSYLTFSFEIEIEESFLAVPWHFRTYGLE